jgi:plastocyanin
MKKAKSIVSLAALLAAAMLFNQECQSQTQAPAGQQQVAQAPAAAPAAPAAAPAAASAGIKAVAKFSGTPPVMGKLKREADPYCAKTQMNDEEVVVNPNGTLKNVAVRIVKGAPAGGTPPAQPATIDQNNCMYRPRVVGAVTGQELQILNSDPVLHNVHAYVGASTAFNQAQMQKAAPIKKQVAVGMTKLKCDVHPWMTAYIIGHDNPYICVTGDSGECTLNVPAGAYTIEAWHEKYGTKTVDVAAGQAAVEVTFAAQ